VIAIQAAAATIQPGASPERAAPEAGADRRFFSFDKESGAALLTELLALNDAVTATRATSGRRQRVIGLEYQRPTTSFAEVQVLREMQLTCRAIH
jgi:hypothetical protein